MDLYIKQFFLPGIISLLDLIHCILITIKDNATRKIYNYIYMVHELNSFLATHTD